MFSVRSDLAKPDVTQLLISSGPFVPPISVPVPPCPSELVLLGRSAEFENVACPSEFQISLS